MLGQRPMTLDDYLAILRRRLWIVLVPALLGPTMAYGLTFLLQERYTSTTLVLVEGQKVPEAYVKSVVSDELNERLATMKEQILSRTRLQPIIEKFGLYARDRKRLSMEELVDRLRAAITVQPVQAMTGTRPGGLPGFTISFTDDDPRRARDVCAEITSMFMDENLKLREQQAEGTTEFLSKQLEEAKRSLDDQDAKLAAFKRRNLGQLPGEEQTSLNILTGYNTQLEGVIQAMNRAQQDKTYLSSLLTQQLSVWQTSKSEGNPETLQQQVETLQNELVRLQAKYTSDHPDVRKLKSDIAELQKRIDQAAATAKDKPEEKDTKAAAQEPPQIQQLRNQIYLQEQTIREKTREQERLQQEIGRMQARLQLTPAVEQQYKELTRDYTTALGFYNELLTKKNASEMATNLERRQQGERFRVMDPANLPEKPSFPDRTIFTLAGSLAGLVLGFAIALLLEAQDKTIRTERDVELLLELPTLAMLPILEPGNGKRTGFWRRNPNPEPQAERLGA
jgi:polysaccharide chain length determinant protein (PEP-CTERM system associated)